MLGELRAQREEFERRMAQPLEARVESGWCLPGLGWRRCDNEDPSVAEFLLQDGNDSRLREGDMVRLSAAAGGDVSVQATIFREEGNSLWLKRWKGTWDQLWLTRQENNCLLDADFLDLSGFYTRALDDVLQTHIGRECILPFLEGSEVEEAADFLNALESLADSPLNERQKDAVAECLAARRCHLVQGPPGTGKTRALAELVRRCVAAGEHVLITSFTHRAIHHALDAVTAQLGNAQCVAKVGVPVFAGASAWRNYESFQASPLAHSDEGWVVGATPFAIQSRLRGVEVDRVIVDEAGQMTMPLALMAMLAGRKWFFFGDGEQLGPVLTSLPQREAREWSCFRMLERLTQKTVLNTGYRMNAGLTEWPSETFYSGELAAAPGVASRRLSLPCPVSEAALAQVLAADSPLVWLAFDHADGNVCQDDEALAAARLMQALVRSGVKPEDMAVVVPWRKQARRIRRRLEGRVPADFSRQCVIDTVEQMQGQEREVVIVSMTSSDAMFLARHAEFIYQPNRLNVAVTRARTKTILLASRWLAEFCPDGVETQEDAALFRSLLNTAARIDYAF